jgi:hypothetical protein
MILQNAVTYPTSRVDAGDIATHSRVSANVIELMSTGVLAAEANLPALTVKADPARAVGTASHTIQVARTDPSIPCSARPNMAPAAGRCTTRHVDPFTGSQTADDSVLNTRARTNTHIGNRNGSCGFSRQDGYEKRGKDKRSQRTQSPDC